MTRRCVSDEEDSDRWQRFPLRDRDIVVSTRSESGTTWVQAVDPAPALVDAAGFGSMRAVAALRTTDRRGVLKDPAAFFRRGRPGEGRQVLAAPDVAADEQRVRRLVAEEAPADPGEVLRLLGVPAG